jgi:hypothetical protein
MLTFKQHGLSYLDKIAAEIQHMAEPGIVPSGRDLSLYRIYAVLLLAKGHQVTLEDVHNAWAAWASESETESRNLVPFKELSAHTQTKDEPYMNAIHEVARRVFPDR